MHRFHVVSACGWSMWNFWKSFIWILNATRIELAGPLDDTPYIWKVEKKEERRKGFLCSGGTSSGDVERIFGFSFIESGFLSLWHFLSCGASTVLHHLLGLFLPANPMRTNCFVLRLLHNKSKYIVYCSVHGWRCLHTKCIIGCFVHGWTCFTCGESLKFLHHLQAKMRPCGKPKREQKNRIPCDAVDSDLPYEKVLWKVDTTTVSRV